MHDRFCSWIFSRFSSGKFVCHHAAVIRESGCILGGESFENLSEALHHFQQAPLGGVYLTQKVRILTDLMSMSMLPLYKNQLIDLQWKRNDSFYMILTITLNRL